ncbi:MAG: hypothetical protein J3Q66DRAFT_405000 [Benniella sp.]|nr:MAG: hypothetical protein J3Q66DRAFT_405000 [Benniella sp.]
MDHTNKPARTTGPATRTQAGSAVVHTVGSDPLLENEQLIYKRHLTSHKYIADQSTKKEKTLDERVTRGPPLEEREALRIVYQIAEGLAAIHRSGVEHMNITAMNILLIGENNDVKICNFTEAKFTGDSYKDTDMKDLSIMMGKLYKRPRERPQPISKWIELCREGKTAKEVSEAFKQMMEALEKSELERREKNH